MTETHSQVRICLTFKRFCFASNSSQNKAGQIRDTQFLLKGLTVNTKTSGDQFKRAAPPCWPWATASVDGRYRTAHRTILPQAPSPPVDVNMQTPTPRKSIHEHSLYCSRAPAASSSNLKVFHVTQKCCSCGHSPRCSCSTLLLSPRPFHLGHCSLQNIFPLKAHRHLVASRRSAAAVTQLPGMLCLGERKSLVCVCGV